MRTYRAGESVEELCRVCKIDRQHTIIVVDGGGQPVRVQCDYCGSQHNSRGETAPAAPAWTALAARDKAAVLRDGDGRTSAPAQPRSGAPAAGPTRARVEDKPALPLVSERERRGEPIMLNGAGNIDLEMLLRRIIREEAGLTPVVPAEKWRKGSLVLKPGNAALQEKSWPIETFLHKVVMIRNRLRMLEQQVNGMAIPEDAKVKLQGYITGCYGSLSSFNLLFADESDEFKGAGGE